MDNHTYLSNLLKSKKQKLIILAGNIGTGKSTIAKLILSKDTNTRFVSIDGVVGMLYGGDYTRFSEIELSTYFELKKQLVTNLIGKGNSVIVEGLYNTIELRSLYNKMVVDNAMQKIIVNCGRGNNRTLANRQNENRGVSPLKWENIHFSVISSWQEPEYYEGVIVKLDEWYEEGQYFTVRGNNANYMPLHSIINNVV